MKVEITREHGVETRTTITPEGMVDVLTYHPCSSVVPWESYGLREQTTIMKVLRESGIDSIALCTHRRNTCAMGTGPRGRIRFGDDMMPSIYRVAVRVEDSAKALMVIQAHREAVTRWLYEGAAMPEACRWT